MKKKVKWIAGGALAFVLAAAGLWMLLAPVRVETETAEYADLTDTFTVTASVEPKNSRYVCAPLAGTVDEVLLREGEQAKAGEAVVVFDDSEAREDLNRQLEALTAQKSGAKSESASARAQLAVSRSQLASQLEQARLNYDQLYGENGRAEELFRIASENFQTANVAYWKAFDEYDGSSNPSEQAALASLESARAASEQALLEADNNRSAATRTYYEEAIAAYESQLSLMDGSIEALSGSAGAAGEQIDAQIRQVEKLLEKTEPSAPFEGIVWEVLAESGDYVVANQPLYRIYGTEEMTLEAELLDTQAALLSVGETASVLLADGTELEAEVVFVSPISTQKLSVLGIEENRCRVELSVEELPERIGAGHQADVTFSVVRKESVLQIPVSAVVPGGAGDAVYVKEGSRAVLREITLGEQSGGRGEVLGGLSEGDKVITDPYDAELSDGKRVSE
ncbi:MAG: efflux RND transporter periplasmic adaptor subunit [Eubacteriales bacterium]|nr:efflux RND transporter periplasmic adaptor subunit [Eubacteriales bacterium]